jgi:outer membrane protein TolC
MRIRRLFPDRVTLVAFLFGLLAGAAIALAAPQPESPVPDQLDLKTTLGYALEHNFAIRQAQERIRQQDGVLVEVKAREIPIVSAGAAYVFNDKEVAQTVPPYDRTWTFSLKATQVLYAGGGVTAGVRSQTIVREASLLAMEAVVDDALLAARTQFLGVLLARDSIKVQEANVALLRRQLQDVRNRHQAGTVSNFEVLRAEVALANAQPALIRARNNYRVAIEQLRFTLGFDSRIDANPGKVPEFIGTLDYVPSNHDLASALAAAREKRPDLRRLQKLEAAAAEGIKVQQAGRRPTVAAFGSYDWNKLNGPGWSRNRDGWTIGLQSQWNIFDGRATDGKVAQARSQFEQSRLATAELTLAIDVDVRRAVSSWQEATELAEASKKVVEAAEESLRLANARFGAGTATQLDVLTSQVALTEARLNQLQAYYSHNVAVAQVRKATGAGDELLGRAAPR